MGIKGVADFHVRRREMILIVNSDDMCVGIYSSHSARVAAAFRAARHKAERIFLKKEGRSFQLRPSFLNIFYTPAKWNTTPITAETPIKTIGCRSLVFLM